LPRKPRIEMPGYHHVLNRGVERRNVFLDQEDFQSFLALLCTTCSQFGVRLHAYVLMHNHYHLLIETAQENLSQFMRRLNADYAIYFNKRYKRNGHLWQGRFKSWYVTDESYLYTLIRYIEYNPLKANMIKKPGEYAFSSCRYFLDVNDKPPACLKGSVIFEQFQSPEERRTFFQSGIDERVLNEIQKASSLVALPEKTQRDESKELHTLFKTVKKKAERNKRIVLAYESGISQHKIATYLKLSQPTVCAIIKRTGK